MANNLGNGDDDDSYGTFLDVGEVPQEEDLVVEIQDEDGTTRLLGRRLPLRRTAREYRYDALRITHLRHLRRAVAILEDILVYLYGLLAYVIGLFAYVHRTGRALQGKIVVVLEGMAWLHCYAYMLTLDVKDHLYFDRVSHRFRPEMNRTIDELSDDDAYSFTGYTKNQLRRLHRHLRIPEVFRARDRIYSGEASFLVFLTEIRGGETYLQMARGSFGGDPRHFTDMSHAMVDHIYRTFYHKISGNSMAMWCSETNVTNFRRAIWSRLTGGLLEETIYRNGRQERQFVRINVDFDTFRPFSLLDCMAQPTSRPGDESMQTTRSDEVDIVDPQRSFYSQYYRGHGLKVLVIFLPNGFIGAVFVASLRHNDNGLVNMSGLDDYLQTLLQGMRLPGSGHLPAIYGDGIFATHQTIIARTRNTTDENAIRVNVRMASSRIFIENAFADNKNLFGVFRHTWRLRLFNGGEYVRKLITVCFLLQNCYYSIHESRSDFFNLGGPTLEQYLPVDEDIPPAPEAVLDGSTEFHYGL